MSTATEGGSAAALAVEQNGINVIHESERKGAPRDLFGNPQRERTQQFLSAVKSAD